MSETPQTAETDRAETLRCIKCQRTIAWPVTSAYPSACLYCGMGYAYTAERVTTTERSGEVSRS